MRKTKNMIVILIFALVIFTFTFNINITVNASDINVTVNTDDSTDLYNPDDFCVAVDYYSETIRIIDKNSILADGREYIEIFDNTGDYLYPGYSGIGKSDFAKYISSSSGDNKYMYALKAVSDDVLNSYANSGRLEKKVSALMNEKWYPIYGGGFDISSVIPAKAARDYKKQYYIAIRRTDDYFNTQSGYETRIAVQIKPRFYDKDLAKYIEYDAEKERIILSPEYSNGSSLSVMYRFDNFSPVNCIISKELNNTDYNIDVSGKYFALGGYVYISAMPFKDSNGNVTYARSKEIKVKIPRVPNAPAVKADLTSKKITSLKKDAMEWSLDGILWTDYTRGETSILFKDIFGAFYGIEEYGKDSDNNYVLYFRTKAVKAKAPASLPKKILIPVEYLG